MARAGVSIHDLAAMTSRDPKTVSRWIGGRVPHPRQRYLVAKHLGTDEGRLWPQSRPESVDGSPTGDLVAAYPYRSSVPAGDWWSMITGAERQIDLLGYTLYFLPLDHPELLSTLAQKCAQGCRVRLVIADPRSPHVANRDQEEQHPITLVARIGTTLKYFRKLRTQANLEFRYQNVPLYNSIFRFDDHMLVTPHLYGTPGAQAPTLRLRWNGHNGLFTRFTDHFESVWLTTTPVPDEDWA
ncbi:hypothetical protein [Microlunatus sp. GCM10028923]|uniref:hypothetical protein n=1 Tax=Microlunatus sp. GCM10028923 TaxID=3273400 RepID=UPI00361BBB5D